MSSFSHKCSEFGKAFQLPDESFYHTHAVTCQHFKNWTSNEIPHPCKCNFSMPIPPLNLCRQGRNVSTPQNLQQNTNWWSLGIHSNPPAGAQRRR